MRDSLMQKINRIFNSDRKCLVFFGACSFVYAILVMVLLREIIIPWFLPSIDGHVLADPFYYHETALEQVNLIRSMGWSGFVMHPMGQGIAGYASIIYMIWENPYAVVFFNALTHAVSVILMVLIIRRWFSIRIALAASMPLFLSPYMMLWFSQINKDSFALIGVLLVLYGLIQLVNYSENRDCNLFLVSFLALVAGAVSLWIVRPYINQMLVPLIISFGVIFLVRSKKSLQSF